MLKRLGSIFGIVILVSFALAQCLGEQLIWYNPTTGASQSLNSIFLSQLFQATDSSTTTWNKPKSTPNSQQQDDLVRGGPASGEFSYLLPRRYKPLDETQIDYSDGETLVMADCNLNAPPISLFYADSSQLEEQYSKLFRNGAEFSARESGHKVIQGKDYTFLEGIMKVPDGESMAMYTLIGGFRGNVDSCTISLFHAGVAQIGNDLKSIVDNAMTSVEWKTGRDSAPETPSQEATSQEATELPISMPTTTDVWAESQLVKSGLTIEHPTSWMLLRDDVFDFAFQDGYTIFAANWYFTEADVMGLLKLKETNLPSYLSILDSKEGPISQTLEGMNLKTANITLLDACTLGNHPAVCHVVTSVSNRAPDIEFLALFAEYDCGEDAVCDIIYSRMGSDAFHESEWNTIGRVADSLHVTTR